MAKTRLNRASTGAIRLALACVLAFSLSGGSALASPSTVSGVSPAVRSDIAGLATIETVAGADRYGTAVAISRLAHSAETSAVVVVNGRAWADALGGVALAGAQGAPVLPVRDDSVPDAVLAEIVRLAPSRIYVLGGTNAIPETVFDALAGVLDSAEVTRVAGRDRYETAAQVASATIAAYSDPYYGRAFVASGHSWADALAAGPVAISTGRPIYLIDEKHSASVIAAMRAAGVRSVTVLGGDAAVSREVRTHLAEEFGAHAVDRVAGADRYETATMIADWAARYYGFDLSRPGLASGERFADALSAGPLLAGRATPLLLAPWRTLPDPVAGWVSRSGAGTGGFMAFGGESALSSRVRQDALHAVAAPPFSAESAMAHIRALAAMGPRGAAGAAERQAAEYVAAQLREYGYAVSMQDVWTPVGTSRNVIAQRKGTSSEVIVLGAHLDSKPPSPGANDNASGVAVTLEIARLLAKAPVTPTTRFVFFGAEEISGATADDHHFGSRQYVGGISESERARIAAMVSIDMVGYGDTFNVRSMGAGSMAAVWSLQGRAGFVEQELPYLRDPGRYGWSDHEGFERLGIPAAWLEWREDPVYHTTRDTASHVQPDRIASTGRLVRGWLLAMSRAQLEALR